MSSNTTQKQNIISFEKKLENLHKIFNLLFRKNKKYDYNAFKRCLCLVLSKSFLEMTESEKKEFDIDEDDFMGNKKVIKTVIDERLTLQLKHKIAQLKEKYGKVVYNIMEENLLMYPDVNKIVIEYMW
jgi:hypothetical protein